MKSNMSPTSTKRPPAWLTRQRGAVARSVRPSWCQRCDGEVFQGLDADVLAREVRVDQVEITEPLLAAAMELTGRQLWRILRLSTGMRIYDEYRGQGTAYVEHECSAGGVIQNPRSNPPTDPGPPF